MLRAETESSGPFRELRDQIERAAAEARAVAEIELRRRNPNAWLQQPPRMTPSTPPRPKVIAKPPPRAGNKRRGSLLRDLFAVEYLKDYNATRAAVRAGYSPKTAASQGHRLLKCFGPDCDPSDETHHISDSDQEARLLYLKEESYGKPSEVDSNPVDLAINGIGVCKGQQSLPCSGNVLLVDIPCRR